MTETKQREWRGKKEERKRLGQRGGIERDMGGGIKGVLRKRKDEKVMKDCQKAQVGKRAGLLASIYLLPQQPKQNHWNIRLWPNNLLVGCVCWSLHTSVIKTGTWAVRWSKRLHWCLLASVEMNILLACTRTDPCKWSKTTSISWNDSDHVFGSSLLMAPASCWCSASWLLCSLIDWPPLLGLSN